MNLRQENDLLNARLKDEKVRTEKLKEELAKVKEELRHYQTAVAAVKWLWDQAQRQPPFQL